ncbi:MAG: hypothetical protein KKE05_03360 [Nanoarchaeota archaeon]|nr:hypothetical protein [Nanoarchaeota archaeon]
MAGIKRILYLVLPLALAISLPSHQEIPPRSFYEPLVSQTASSPRTTIKFSCGGSGIDYAIGVRVENGDRLDIYGFSTFEGPKKISCHQEGDKIIVDSGL